eukprot:TRINITY_DN15625_c0_g1_i1.p1 TRINITY_DN15625_c0_g1~~TRINITY_DN15625_c0_g1_i1.p1  ORF type:complete len:111 (+),score=16.24 TRINITY_DN15625_c0_g1_i1:29-334(+)
MPADMCGKHPVAHVQWQVVGLPAMAGLLNGQSVDFGDVPVGSSSSRSIRIENTGTGALRLHMESMVQPFEGVSFQGQELVIGAKQNTDLVFLGMPVDVGAR